MTEHWTARIEPEGKDGRIDLADDMLSALGLSIGDQVELVVRDGGLFITPVQS